MFWAADNYENHKSKHQTFEEMDGFAMEDDMESIVSETSLTPVGRRTGPGRRSNAEKAAEQAAKDKREREDKARAMALEYMNTAQTMYLNGTSQEAIGQKVFDDNFSVEKMQEYELGLQLLAEDSNAIYKNETENSFVFRKVIYRFYFMPFHLCSFSSDDQSCTEQPHPHF